MKNTIYSITLIFLFVGFAFSAPTNVFIENNLDIALTEISEEYQRKCSATTKRGYRCKNKAKKNSYYCGTHSRKKTHDDGWRYTSGCSAISKSTGVQCRNKAKKGSMYCGVHD
jgi:hypothetical protein